MSAIVDAKLYYLVPPTDGSKPYVNINTDPVTGERGRNYGQEERIKPIENVRGKEETLTLDTAGFQFFNAPSKHKSFESDSDIQAEYYPESVELIKKLTGATRVVLFDHTIRRNDPSQPDTPSSRQPVANVHVDQTTAAAIARVHRHLPPTDAQTLLKRRFQIINLWRPISHPALDHPLALCDYRSIDPDEDLAPVTLKYPDRDGETFGVKYNEKHRWVYLRGMTPDEIVLIKCFDSIEDGTVARLTPHTSFEDSSTPLDTLPRESIELRALVFYE